MNKLAQAYYQGVADAIALQKQASPVSLMRFISRINSGAGKLNKLNGTFGKLRRPQLPMGFAKGFKTVGKKMGKGIAQGWKSELQSNPTWYNNALLNLPGAAYKGVNNLRTGMSNVGKATNRLLRNIRQNGTFGGSVTPAAAGRSIGGVLARGIPLAAAAGLAGYGFNRWQDARNEAIKTHGYDPLTQNIRDTLKKAVSFPSVINTIPRFRH